MSRAAERVESRVNFEPFLSKYRFHEFKIGLDIVHHQNGGFLLLDKTG